MTKLRAPLTTEQALVRIAALIGWDAMAEACATPDRSITAAMLRKWADPDTRERFPLDAGIALDIAYAGAGGDGFPIYETYGLLLEVARAERFADAAELARRTITAIKEGGEASAALVRASQPGATDRDRADAAREVEENLAALKQTLPLLTTGAGPTGTCGEGSPRGGAVS